MTVEFELEQLIPAPAPAPAPTSASAYTSAILDPLFAALHRLDHVLDEAMARLREPAASVKTALADAPAPDSDGVAPDDSVLYGPVADGGPVAVLGGGSRLDWLAHAFGLEPFDLDLVVLALAPEVDPRYERLFAYLHDDFARRRPTVGLALELLGGSPARRLARRQHFASSAPLVRHRLLRLPADGASAGAPLLAQSFALDPQIANLLLGIDALDGRLVRWCQLRPRAEHEDGFELPGTLPAGVPALVERAAATAEPVHLYFHGPAGAGKEHASLAVAAAAGMPHLTIDVAALLASDEDAAAVLALALRDAWLRDALPYLRGADLLWREERYLRRVPLRAVLEEHFGPVVLGGTQPWVPGTAELAGVVAVPIGVPNGAARRRLWASSLAAAELDPPPAAVDTLAARFRLTAGQIAEATATAAQRLSAATPERFGLEPSDLERELFAAARGQTGHELGALALKIPVVHGWRDLVLPDEALAQLHEITQRVAWRERVLDDWGFGARLSRGRGVNALFAGASGTGKTMAAEVLARELGLDLYRVELAGVVSKYIGETEKNLDRIFTAAEHSNSVLLFDEADALFGKRSEVRDAHDRYANIEISYLLQRMESYEGIAILATNLRGNLDAAFVRRLAFTIVFPFPDAASRREIWARIWPAETPRAPDVDFVALAERFPLSGGHIRNIALAAAFLAAEEGKVVTLAHVLHATRREYQKLGKTLTAEELGGGSVTEAAL